MTSVLPDDYVEQTCRRYSDRYLVHGYSPKTLGWDKGKQALRFRILTSCYEFSSRSVIDIGCGFGDLNKTLSEICGQGEYEYLGIDLVDDLILEAKSRYQSEKIRFMAGDFLRLESASEYDYAIASGIFNYKYEGIDNYEIIDASIAKALDVCRDGLAFDFLSDKVDYRLEHAFHSSPEKILALAFRHSRNVVLRNDYMPFEFSLFIFKDDSFEKEDTVFTRHKQICSKRPDEF